MGWPVQRTGSRERNWASSAWPSSLGRVNGGWWPPVPSPSREPSRRMTSVRLCGDAGIALDDGPALLMAQHGVDIGEAGGGALFHLVDDLFRPAFAVET